MVSKKRNTSKGLQALINGKYIVTDSFVDALEAATIMPEGDAVTARSALEEDFDGSWPDPLQYLPPRGGEPVERPNSSYAPDDKRQEVFDGYTFIFYDSSQYETLLAPITNGKGKALYTEVKPGETSVDDFILFVKTEAGEKGLGSFEDGSEGRGVVVVRYIPAKGEHIEWFSHFFTDVSQRLDHRPIEQNEFLESILESNAAILRRALEAEPSQPGPSGPLTSSADTNETSEAAPRRATRGSQRQAPPEPAREPSPPPRRRTRREPKRRFKGFDDSSDEDTKLPIIPDMPPPADSQEALFVSQEVEPIIVDETESSVSSRKRHAQELEDELMDEIVPGAAAAKRRRIEAGEDPMPWRSTAEAAAKEKAEAEAEDEAKAEAEAAKKAVAVKKESRKKAKVEIDVLEEARKQREKLDAEAKAEEEDLARLPADLDFAAIRANHIIIPMKVREPRRGPPTREEDIASGRWDPRWNGRKNFKKFRPQGAPTGRPPVKVIVPLKEVKTQGYGIGDDYWLEGDGRSKKSGKDTQKSAESSGFPESPVRSLARKTQRVVLTDDSDMDGFLDDNDDGVVQETPQPAPARGTRSTRSAATQSQGTGAASSASMSTRQSKRSAGASLGSEPPAKKAKPARRAFEVKDSDEDEDSDDGLRFKFGQRRRK